MTDLTSQSQSNDPLLRLLQETASGDRDAFRLLYDASSAKLFGVLLRILKRQDLAEEVLQDVYLLIWTKANLYNPSKGRPLSWMCAIARNRALDALRTMEEKVQKQEFNEGEDEPLTSTLHGLSPSLSTGSDQKGVEKLALEACLNEASEQSRDCVLLAYVHGYSREELASRYSVPVNTIKTWLRRALIDLKNCLER